MKYNKTQVTIFKDVFDKENPHFIDVLTVFERIKNGKSSKIIVEQLQTEIDKTERARLKKKLPVICFAGEFKTRHNTGLINHSGLICLDFDHLGDKLESFRVRVEADKYTMACFVSPSGDGLKVIVKIPNAVETHKSYFESLKLHFKEQKLDDDCEVVRCCFESYDPNIYINPNSSVFDILIKPKVEIPIDYSTKVNKINDVNVIYAMIKKWAEKQGTYEDGNKHTFLVSISSACNRFGLSQDFTETSLIRDYQNKASFVDSADFIDIINRIYISYNNQFDISWLTSKGEINDFNPSGPARDVIYLNDIRKEMLQSFEQGDSEGETTYFKTLDDYWKWKKGELTLMHGIPNHGKTILTLQLCLIKSIKEGKKWGIFSPEQNPPIDFYKDLIHTYIGKSTEKYHSNQMSMDEYNKGMDFIHEHFYFVYPKDESPTPDYINERFGELIVKHKINGCIIDPFNQLDNDYGKHGRDDIYISSFLNKEKRFALTNNLYKMIIAHPKGGLVKGKEGNYECPDVYNVSGGAMWNNKCDNILVTYRPYYNTDKTNPEVEFRSQKIKKQKYVGIPGTTKLRFNRATNRYEEFAVQSEGVEIMNITDGISPFDNDYIEKYNLIKAPSEGLGGLLNDYSKRKNPPSYIESPDVNSDDDYSSNSEEVDGPPID